MPGRLEKILVPIDGSQSALHAVAFAADLALAHGASMTLLFVAQATAAESIGLASRPKSEVQESLRVMASGAFERAMEVIAEAGGELEVRQLTDIGDPADEIISQALATGADLIVMGSRGMGPLKGLLLGSVSEKVVRRAPCPVTIVR